MSNSISSYLNPYIVGNALEALAGTTALLANTNKDMSTAAASKGDTVTMGVPTPLTAGAVTAANTAPAPSDITIGKRSIELSNEYKTSFALTGKETQDYELSSVVAQQIRAAVQGMAYKVNATLWEKYYQIPYAVGNSGTGFFASNANGLSDMDKVLTDNFCPIQERKFVGGTKDYAALVNLTEVHYANQFGGNVAQSGVVGDVRGFEVNRDQQVPTHSIGSITTGAICKAATAVAAGVATIVGTTAASTGKVDFKQGDLVDIAHASGTRTYSVQTAVAQATAAGEFTLVLDRGVEFALIGSEAITLSTATSTFDADSILAIGGRMDGYSVVGRLPEVAPMGYQTQGEHMPIIDPVSGFPFMISIYPQYKQVALEVSAIWGVEVTDSRKLCRALTYSS